MRRDKEEQGSVRWLFYCLEHAVSSICAHLLGTPKDDNTVAFPYGFVGEFLQKAHYIVYRYEELLRTLPDERIREELVESKRQAEAELGHPIEFIAYPTGAHDLHIVGIAQEAGYKGGFTVKYGNVDRASNVYALERVPIFRTAATNTDFVDRLRYTSNITQFGWTRN